MHSEQQQLLLDTKVWDALCCGPAAKPAKYCEIVLHPTTVHNTALALAIPVRRSPTTTEIQYYMTKVDVHCCGVAVAL
jgi:hypothetical protein